MRPELMISTAVLVPLTCLGLLLLLGWLEETLEADVHKAVRRSRPAPIREMPIGAVRAPHPAGEQVSSTGVPAERPERGSVPDSPRPSAA
jgi:hypothetical protein